MKTEKHPATVTDNSDPEKRGRFKVKCLGLIGDSETELPDWVTPAFDWGWFVVPDVGEEVEIEVVVEDETRADTYGQAFLEAPRLRWRGKRFPSTQGDEPRPPNEQLTDTNYGKRRGFATPNGHVLLFDDTEGGETVTLSWKKAGEEKYAFLSMDSDGSLVLSNVNGSLLYLNAKDGELALVDEHGNSVSSGATSMQIIDTFNNSVELKDGAVTVLAAGDALVTAGKNVMIEGGSDCSLKAAQKGIIDAPQVELGQVPTDFVALSLLVYGEIEALRAAIASLTPVPNDGGATIITKMQSHVVGPVAAAQVKAK